MDNTGGIQTARGASRLVVMLGAVDGGPELRVMQMAGVLTGTQPADHTHVVLRVGRLAMELAEQPRSDSGEVGQKW